MTTATARRSPGASVTSRGSADFPIAALSGSTNTLSSGIAASTTDVGELRVRVLAAGCEKTEAGQSNANDDLMHGGSR